MKTFASMFTGGGLADVGAIAAGCTPIWGVEIDPEIAEVASLNLKHRVICKSVLDVDPSTLEKPDILWASPPCVNFSVAKRNGQELNTDKLLAVQISNFVSTLQPPVFILENVRGYRRSESFQSIKDALSEYGYQIDEQVINSAEFGVPQTRHRLILRAVLGGIPPELPARIPKDRWVGWYDAISDLIPELPETKLAQWQLDRLSGALTKLLSESNTEAVLIESKNANQQYGDGLRSSDEPATTIITDHKPSHAPKALLINRNQSERGDLWREADQGSYTVCAEGSCGRTRAVLIDTMHTIRQSTARDGGEPSYTITADKMRRPISTPKAILISGQGDRGKSITFRKADEPSLTVMKSSDRQVSRAWVDLTKVVTMTPRALARFQTLPDWYVLPENPRLACKIIGNGVPCLLAEKIVSQFDGFLANRALVIASQPQTFPTPVYQSSRATLFEGDNIVTLDRIEPESIDCGIDSPPYFNMADYKDDRQHGWEPTLDQYLDVQAKVRYLQLNTFKEGGVLAIVIDDTINNYSAVRAKGQRKKSGEWGKRRELQDGYLEKSLIDVTGDYIKMMRGVGWHPILKLPWDKGTGGRKTSFSAFTHEYVLFFVKQTSGRRLYPAHFIPFKKSILRHTPASHPAHPCPFPVSLATEVLDHIMPPGGTVMDVYCGTGNSGRAALRAGGFYVGLDLNCEWAVQAMQEEECPPRVVQLELLA